MKTGPWSLAEDAIALQHLHANKSFSEVEKLIGRPRSAIISRAHRKGWNWPGKKSNSSAHVSLPPASTPSRPSPSISFNHSFVAPITPSPKPNHVPPAGGVLLDNVKENQCRFISGDSRSRVCCGAQTSPGRPWCPDHAQIVFGTTPKEPRAAIAH